MGKKLTPNQAEFERQTKRIRDMMKGMEGQGYKFSRSPIDDLPQRVSAKKISELQSVTPDTLKRYADKPDNKPHKVGSQAAEEAPHRRTSHLNEDDTSTGVGRRGGNHNGNPANLQHNGNPANLQHKGNPANLQHNGNPDNLQHKGNPANLQHKGNPANLQPHPENLQHKGNPANLQHKGNPANLKPHPENLQPHPENLKAGGKKGKRKKRRNKKNPTQHTNSNAQSAQNTDMYGMILHSFWEVVNYDFKSVYGQQGRDIVADWANGLIGEYGEEMFVKALKEAADNGKVLTTEMMYDDTMRLDFFLEVVDSIHKLLGDETSFDERENTIKSNSRDGRTLNERINEITADARYQRGEEENYYDDWD